MNPANARQPQLSTLCRDCGAQHTSGSIRAATLTAADGGRGGAGEPLAAFASFFGAGDDARFGAIVDAGTRADGVEHKGRILSSKHQLEWLLSVPKGEPLQF